MTDDIRRRVVIDRNELADVLREWRAFAEAMAAEIARLDPAGGEAFLRRQGRVLAESVCRVTAEPLFQQHVEGVDDLLKKVAEPRNAAPLPRRPRSGVSRKPREG